MDAYKRSVLTSHGQDVKQLLVVQADTIVGHEDLDRRVTGLDQLGQMLLQRYLGRIRDDHVEGVVDNRTFPSLGGVLVDDLGEISGRDVAPRKR